MGGTEWAILVGIIVAWLALTRWVLPACGIDTCCCSAKKCSTETRTEIEPDAPAEQHDEPDEKV